MGTNPVFASPNRLKLGLFCTNTVSALTLAPELFTPTWENCLAVARKSDALGLEAIVPIARWKGYLDNRFDHPNNDVLDVFTYAAAIAQATHYSGIFATTHAPTFHPVLLAKQAATIDLISDGRFSLNIVGGWNRREFDMFGIELLGHAERYDYLGEWLGIVRRLWRERAEFDVETAHFHMKGALSRPQPVQPGGIPIMNAGMSEIGNRFAAQHADIGFVSLTGADETAWGEQVAAFKAMARDDYGRDVKVWTNAFVTIRDTENEAHAYVRRFSDELLDRETVDSCLATMAQENPMPPGSPRYEHMKQILTVGVGLPVTGSPRTVAERLAAISAAGVDGVLITAVDFIDALDRLERDVLPLLEAAGLRVPFGAVGT